MLGSPGLHTVGERLGRATGEHERDPPVGERRLARRVHLERPREGLVRLLEPAGVPECDAETVPQWSAELLLLDGPLEQGETLRELTRPE
jgi:hypothetical protein